MAGASYVVRVGTHSSNDGPDFHPTSGETIVAFYILGIAIFAAFLWRVRSLQSLPWFRSVGNFVESGQGRLVAPPKAS